VSYTRALMCELPVIPGALAAILAAAFLFLLLCGFAAARSGETGMGAALICGMASAVDSRTLSGCRTIRALSCRDPIKPLERPAEVGQGPERQQVDAEQRLEAGDRFPLTC
jgi:hypothetical protein